MTSFLVNSARWIFIAALVIAPWLYGCTRLWTIQALDVILGVMIAAWLAGCIGRRRWPAVPWLLAACSAVVLLLGWFLIANAQASYDRDAFQFNPLKQLVPFAPGVVDRTDSIPNMLNVTAMLGTLCFVTDLVRRDAWRTRIWWTAAVNGIVLMLWGLGMKIAGVHIVSDMDSTNIGWDSFAYYFYHGNAGAYINLILPLVAGLAALAFVKQDASSQRALWLPGLLVCLASSAASLSKGAMAIALGLMIVLGIWYARFSGGRRQTKVTAGQRAVIIIVALIVVGAMLSLSLGGVADRWERLASPTGKEESMSERLLVSQICIHMMSDSGFWGFGPGNFSICFPHYSADVGNAVAGIWYYAHEDYLQTIVEWGYVGAAFFAVILFGGFWTGWRRLRGAPLADADSVLLTMALFALLGVSIHAAFDFPFQIASLQLYAATWLGLCWGSGGIASPSIPVRRRRSFGGISDAEPAAGPAAGS